MKKFFVAFSLILSCLFSILMVSCSSNFGASRSDLEKPRILSMNRMIHDCVVKIAGDQCYCEVLIDGGLDPHNYEIVKGDSDKFLEANVVFCGGLGLEHTLSLRKLIEVHPDAVYLGNLLAEKKFFTPLREGAFFDPHIWLDMGIWKHVSFEISDKLSEIDPENAPLYRERAEALFKEIGHLDLWARKCLGTIPEQNRYLVTGHNAFSYFTRSYLASPKELLNGKWRERCCSPEGISPEAQIGIQDIIRVCNYICQYDVDVVFPEESLNQDSLKKIVDSLHKQRRLRIACDVLFSDGVKPSLGFFETFKSNVALITQELGGCVAGYEG